MSTAAAVLIVAAEGFELGGLLRRLDGKTRLDWPLQFAWEGRRGEQILRLVAHGPGPKLAGQAADTARARGVVRAVVSTGLCGALDPALRVGDIFVASRVLSVGTEETFVGKVNELARERRYAEGLLCSMDRVAATVRDKAVLRALGGSAVDMEAAAVAERGRDWNVPFFCVRVVSDTAGESFSMDFNEMRDIEGRFERGRIALRALGRPWRHVPELMRLARRGRSCADTLGELLADCRF